MTPTPPVFRRLTLALLLSTAVPATVTGSLWFAGPTRAAAATPGLSPAATATATAGSYLAGRFAHQHDDWTAASRFATEALAGAPDDRLLMEQAVIYRLGDGRAESAVDLAQKLIDRGEASPAAILLIAADAIKKDDPRKAVSVLNKLGHAGIWALVSPLFRAWLAAAERDTDKALSTLEPLAGNPGLKALTDLHSGLILEMGGRKAEAEERYRRLLDSPPGVPLVVAEVVGSYFLRTGQLDEVRNTYQRFVDTNRDSSVNQPLLETLKGTTPQPPFQVFDARRGLAMALFDLSGALHREQLSEMALLFGRLSLFLDPTLRAARLGVAEILNDRNQPEAALSEYQNLARDPLLGRNARLHSADALFDLKRDDEAVALLSALSAERSDLNDADIRLGDYYRGRKEWDKAIPHFDEAIRRAGTPGERQWRLLYARAICEERSGRWAEAEADLKTALKFRPDDAFLLNYLGYSWIERGENLDQAKKMVERAVTLEPRDGYIADSLGWAQYKLGDYAAAAATLERAVELKPVDATINDHLGDAYWRVGRRAEARFQWQRAARMATEDDKELKTAIAGKLDSGLPEVKTAVANPPAPVHTPAATPSAVPAPAPAATPAPATPAPAAKNSGKKKQP